MKSYYRNRIDFGDITYSFNKVLEKTFCDEFGLEVGNYDLVGLNQEVVKSKINLDFKNAEDEIMLDVHIDTSLFDKMDEKTIKSDKTISGVYSENDIIYAVENLIKVNLNDHDADFLTAIQLIQELKIPSAKQFLIQPYLDSLIDFKIVGFDEYLESL